MDPNLTISTSGDDPKQPPLLPKDADLALSGDDSAPGSGSSPNETEALGLDPKRQKIDDDDDGGDEEEEEEADDDDDVVWTQAPSEPVILYPEDEEGRQKFHHYYEQIRESEGFDFDELPPVDVLECGVVPIDMEDDYDGVNVRECVKFVIDQHNAEDKGVSQLRLDTIEKANYAPVDGTNYYITFKATNTLFSGPEGATKVYQAEVYRERDGTMETHSFVRKAKNNQFEK